MRAKQKCALGIAIFFALAGAGGSRASDAIAGTSDDYRALEFGNSNKMEKGRQNALHAVFSTGYEIAYISSADGDNWTPEVYLNVSGNYADQPALAANSVWIVVVWREHDESDLGTLMYAWRKYNNPNWTTSELVTAGKEPSIALRGSTVHVTWSTGNSVQYYTFPFNAPPSSPLVLGEVVENTICPNTTFTKPSIALVRNPCYPPIVKIGYLVAADEQSGGLCANNSTKVGARVESRNSGVWTQVYEHLTTAGPAPNAVDPISLSLASKYSNGDLYLAWSTEQNGVAATRLTTGNDSTWQTPVAVEAERRHVHVRANNENWASAGQYRLAYGVSESSQDNYGDSYYRNGNWGTGVAFSWSGAFAIGQLGTRLPQAQFWRTNSLSGSSGLNTYFEQNESWPFAGGFVGTDYWSSPFSWPAPPYTPIGLAPCEYLRKISIAGLLVHGAEGTTIDVTDFGLITKISDAGATLTTHEGKTVTITWGVGRVARSWDEGLVVTTARRNVRFSSPDTSFTVEDDGYLREYDAARQE